MTYDFLDGSYFFYPDFSSRLVEEISEQDSHEVNRAARPWLRVDVPKVVDAVGVGQWFSEPVDQMPSSIKKNEVIFRFVFLSYLTHCGSRQHRKQHRQEIPNTTTLSQTPPT